MTTARTVRQVIEAALRKNGDYDVGETPTAEDIQVGLFAFQDLIAEWASDGLMIPFITQEAITLVAGQKTYTVGENGAPDLNTVRPELIIGAFIRDGGTDSPVEIIGEKSYREISTKSQAGLYPEKLWYNPTAPNGTVYVWPAPGAAYSLYISSEKPTTEPSTTGQNILNDLGIPRNYCNPIIYNLAVHIGLEFGHEPSQTIIGLAGSGLSRIRGLNAARRVQPAALEITSRGFGYNIMNG